VTREIDQDRDKRGTSNSDGHASGEPLGFVARSPTQRTESDRESPIDITPTTPRADLQANVSKTNREAAAESARHTTKPIDTGSRKRKAEEEEDTEDELEDLRDELREIQVRRKLRALEKKRKYGHARGVRE